MTIREPEHMPENSGRILVLTVGTGNIDSIEKTLLTPLRKSIATDAWKAVVLLPSTVTASFADRLRQDLDRYVCSTAD